MPFIAILSDAVVVLVHEVIMQRAYAHTQDHGDV
jgi:hypothetical protein